MLTTARLWVLAALCGIAVCTAAHAATVTVPVDSSDSAAWARAPGGGTGTTMPAGGAAIWNGTFTASIPAGATNISFKLDSFLADDKGVVKLNGTTIADAVVQRPNGTAAGAGTFDFGLGGGNQAYNFVGFTPGATFALPNGTTQVTLVVYMNDTSTTDPMAPPLPATFISSFSMSGSLQYDPALAGTSTAVNSSQNPSTVGQSVTLTATVTGSGPTGTVQFFDGASAFGGPIVLAGGTASLTTSALTAGSHPITAVYSGDQNNAGSTSPILTQLVNPLPSVAVREVPTLSGMAVVLLSLLLGVYGLLRRR